MQKVEFKTTMTWKIKKEDVLLNENVFEDMACLLLRSNDNYYRFFLYDKNTKCLVGAIAEEKRTGTYLKKVNEFLKHRDSMRLITDMSYCLMCQVLSSRVGYTGYTIKKHAEIEILENGDLEINIKAPIPSTS